MSDCLNDRWATQKQDKQDNFVSFFNGLRNGETVAQLFCIKEGQDKHDRKAP